MNCTSCGGPLEAKTIVCRFCGTHNDIDLRSARRVARENASSDRPCPTCGDAMTTLDIGRRSEFLVERCDVCLGLFFDPGELERLVEADAVADAPADSERLARIVEEETPGPRDDAIRYKPCPVCTKLMNRQAYGRRSGVVVDRCKDHGVWLDGGELRRILAWMQAGGKEHQSNVEAEENRLRERREYFKQVLERREDRRRGTDRRHDPSRIDGLDVLESLFGLFD